MNTINRELFNLACFLVSCYLTIYFGLMLGS